MSRLKQLILEVHRRSLWQVLVVYLGASWGVLEAIDHVVDRYLLPEWVSGAAVVLLLIGLPIVLATAMVREAPSEESPASEVRDPTLLAARSDPGHSPRLSAYGARVPAALGSFLTWPKAILGGVLAFLVLAGVSASIILKGTPRVAEARGTAGDAFEERAWIVVPEFEAPEEEADVAAAAHAALVVDLQQSRYVNVFSHNQIEPVLRRMGRPDTARIDEHLALEVAEREGLAAVLAAEVGRLGSDYVLSARVVEPEARRDLIAVRAVSRADRLAEGVESLSREVRERLGEEREAIERSKPLPQVTTRSLDALKRYARAVEALEAQDPDRAIQLASEAVRLDSTFAMAYRLLGVAYGNTGRIAQASEYSARAYELRDRLTERERLHVEASHASSVAGDFDIRGAAETYEHLLSLYPDDDRAANNLGWDSSWLGDEERAYEAYMRAVKINPYNPLMLQNAILTAQRVGRLEVADSLIRVGEELGFEEPAARWRLRQAVTLTEWDRAEALCDSLLAASSGPARLAEDRLFCGALYVSRGRLQKAISANESAAGYYLANRRHLFYGVSMYVLTLADAMRGRVGAARARLESMLVRLPGDSLPQPEESITRQGLRFVATELELEGMPERIRSAYALPPDTSLWTIRYGERLGDAAEALARGEPERALRLLEEARAFGVSPPAWRPMLDFLQGRAFAAVEEPDSAVVYLERVVDPALAAERPMWLTRFSITKRRVAELEESRGRRDAAMRHYRELLDLWSGADPEMAGQVRATQRALARLSGAESEGIGRG